LDDYIFSGKRLFSFCSCEICVLTVMLSLRPTGLSSPAYRDWADYIIIQNGRAVGRVYEDRHVRPELRWCWSITVFVGSRPGISTHGGTATMEEAKAQFLANWQQYRAVSTPPAPRSI
jgi:hypothetical protein